jgi:colanic acid/amylovoran biosynthesis glycosyltransferase
MTSEIRVLHAFNLYGNPSEIWGFRLLESLEASGVHQGVITAQFWPGHFPERPWEVYRLPLLSGYHPQAYLRRQLSYLLTPVLLRPRLSSGQWHLLHAHFGTAGRRFAPLAGRLGIPLVVSFYGTDYQAVPQRRPVWRRRYEALFQQAYCVLAEGPHGAGLLREMGCPDAKIQMQRLGVMPGPEPVLSRQKPAGSLRLVQVASFVEKKGQEDSIRAFAKALPACPGATLTLAGDAKRLELLRLARGLGVEAQIAFRDFVPYEQLRNFLSDFDVFIHPSHIATDMDSEGGIPTILFEAMAAGLPVISTRHCDIPQLVLHGLNGFLAPERDPEALSAYIRTVYQMPEAEMRAFRQAARRQVVENYDIAGVGRRLAGTYREIVGSSVSPAKYFE